MRIPRSLLGLAGAALVLGATATTASAGNNEPIFGVFYNCDGLGIIHVNVDSVTDEGYDVVIGIGVFQDVANDEVFANSFENGFVPVEIYEADTDNLVYNVDVPVGCGVPFVAVDVECKEDGAHLFINIADEEGWSYDVYVDDTNTPVEGWEDVSDTDWAWEEIGVYPSGTHTVYVDWYENESEEFYFQEVLTDACNVEDEEGEEGDEEGSGAGLPASGSESTPLALIAGGLLVLGSGLLLVRRTHLA